jgi:hypothetical protein
MGGMLPEREAFFPNRDGVAFSSSTVDTWFHEFWDCLPEAETATGNTARVHDFRYPNKIKIQTFSINACCIAWAA